LRALRLAVLPLIFGALAPMAAGAAPARLAAELRVGGAAAEPLTVPIHLGERDLGEISEVLLDLCLDDDESSGTCDGAGTVTLDAAPAAPFHLAGAFREVVATGVVTPVTFPVALQAGQRLKVVIHWAVDRVGDVDGSLTLGAVGPGGEVIDTLTILLSGTGAALDACFPFFGRMCLGDGRFKLEARFLTNAAEEGEASPVHLTSDTGYFWFFGSANVEAVIKVLNGCPVNNRYWVFAGGLTNVHTLFTVADLQAGVVKTYVNPQNLPFQPIQDTSAFATCP
jgi:hypothetical protein